MGGLVGECVGWLVSRLVNELVGGWFGLFSLCCM